MRNLSTHRFVQKYWLKRLCLNELAIWFTFGKTQIILPKALAHYSNGRCCIELQSISGLLHSMKNAITRVRLNSGSNKFWSSIRGIYWNLLRSTAGDPLQIPTGFIAEIDGGTLTNHALTQSSQIRLLKERGPGIWGYPGASFHIADNLQQKHWVFFHKTLWPK